MTSILLTCAQGGCGDLSGYLSALTHVGEEGVSLTPKPTSVGPLLPSVLTNDSLPPVSYRVLPLDLGHVWALTGGNVDMFGAPQALDLCRAWRGPRVLAHALDVGNVCRAWLSGKPSQLARELEGVRASFEGEVGVQGRVLLMGSAALLSPVGDVGGDIEGVRRALRGAPELPISTTLPPKSSHSSLSPHSITQGLGLSESQCSSLAVFFRLLALHLKASLIAMPGPGLDVTPTLDVLLLEGGAGGLIPPVLSPPEQALIPWGSDSVLEALASLAPLDKVWGERVGGSLSGVGEDTTTTIALITTPPPCFVRAASALSPATCASLSRGSNAWALDCALLARTFMHNASKSGVMSTEKWAESLVGGPSTGEEGEQGGSGGGDGVAAQQAKAAQAQASVLTNQPPRASLRSSGGVGPRASLSRRSSFGVASEVGSAVSGGGSSTASVNDPPPLKAPVVAAQPPLPPPSAPAPPVVKDPKAFFTSLAAGGKPPKKK